MWEAGRENDKHVRSAFSFSATSSVLFHSWLVRVCSTGVRGRGGAVAPSLSVSSPVAQNAVRATTTFLVVSFAFGRRLAKLSGLLVHAATCWHEESKTQSCKALATFTGFYSHAGTRTRTHTSRTCDPCARYPPCHWTTPPFCQSSVF